MRFVASKKLELALDAEMMETVLDLPPADFSIVLIDKPKGATKLAKTSRRAWAEYFYDVEPRKMFHEHSHHPPLPQETPIRLL